MLEEIGISLKKELRDMVPNTKKVKKKKEMMMMMMTWTRKTYLMQMMVVVIEMAEKLVKVALHRAQGLLSGTTKAESG
jgi:hypothetical protein